MVEFNEDGSIKWSEDLLARKKEEPFICVLKAINEIPFSVGKKLLIDVLQGNEENKYIEKIIMSKIKYSIIKADHISDAEVRVYVSIQGPEIGQIIED